MSDQAAHVLVNLILNVGVVVLLIVAVVGLVADFSIYTFRAVRKFWDRGQR